tara:strand:- start:437 stop:832 length:396 start_codon:yes stop_codon:yes gene_type:complete
MTKQGQTRRGTSKRKVKKKVSKQGKVRFSAPLEPKKGGGFKKQSRIRVKKTGRKEEIFYTGPERGGPKGFGKKGKVTTKKTPAGRKVQIVKGKSLNKRLKRTLGDKIAGTGKDKAKRLKRQHMFGQRRKFD